MAGRGPRSGGFPAGGSARPGGLSRPSMNRTQMLREAKTAAIVQKDARERRPEGSARPGGHAGGPRTSLARVGPRPAPPKKIDLARPTTTKTMQMRQKLAAERIAAADRQREDPGRRPRRTPAPLGGDARLGRERRGLQDTVGRGQSATGRGRGRPIPAGGSRRPSAGPSGVPRSAVAMASPISEGTEDLARQMNAEIVTAVAQSEVVDKVIIAPGTINSSLNTIVCIVPPQSPPPRGAPDGTILGGSSEAANKSLQVINESLDEQDAIETAAVQEKLEELQNARREFVVAVANVSTNAVGLDGHGDDSILDLEKMEGLDYIQSPPRPRRIYKVPDISHRAFQPEYGRDHPSVAAAREFSRKLQKSMDDREQQRRLERVFEKHAHQQIGELDFDVPFEQDFQEGDISFEEDAEGYLMPCPSRIKASMRIPQKINDCPQRGANVQEIERFFDVQRYPPSPERPGRPPPGRENLHPDLWEFEDIWYHEETQPEGPDLMRFDDCC